MMKVIFLVALAIGCVAAQSSNGEESAGAPEPYAYSYQTDSSSASEQRSADGKVTGYYTLVDATDGRERRVDYEADANGFRAKVATNELGTKSENPANVEIVASPPTEAQLVAYQRTQQVQHVTQVQQEPQVQQYFSVLPQQQRVSYVQTSSVPTVSTNTVTYKQQQQPNYAAYRQQTYSSNVQQPGAVYSYGYAPAGYGYTSGYGTNQNVVYGGYGGYGTTGAYYNPGQYYQGVRYSSIGGVAQPAVSYGVGSAGGSQYSRTVTTSGVGTVPVGSSSLSYSSGPVTTVTRKYSSSSSSGSPSADLGSGNVLLLQKRK